MKILVLGSTGMLGSTIYKFFRNKYSVDFCNRTDIDFSECSISALSDTLLPKSPNLILNCVGLIKQRDGVSPETMIEINGVFPHKLANVCSSNNIKLIHFSTDCVFNGTKGSYNETDAHDANDLYGKSKSIGESDICTIIRSSIIGEEIYNKLSLVEWVRSKANQTINGYTNHTWNGITCVQMAKVIESMIINNYFWSGVRHIYSESISKYKLIQMINTVYDLNIKINPVLSDTSVDRSITSIYDNMFNIPTLNDQIKEMKNFYEQHNYT